MSRQKKTPKNNKIKKYRKPLNINLGLMIFGFIFVYIIVMVFFYLTSSHIAGYEVKAGSLAVNNTYRGVVLRKESVYKTTNSGYINYYAREGERVAKGALVYTVDESGKLSEMINSNLESGESLSDQDMSELKTQIINYHNNYNDKDFDSVYDFKFMVQGTVLKLANQNVLSSLSDLTNSSIKDFINFSYSDDSGIVIYSTDGLESLRDSDITEDTFVEENHAKTQLQSNSLIDVDDAAYKIITDEKWSVVIPIDHERAQEIKDEGYLQVRFLKTGDESWGAVTVFEKNGKQYAKLTFTNSMITFASDRYLDIELLLDTEVGLKIPNSAIVEKEFYLIPKEYITKGGDSDNDGFMREAYLEDGTVSTEFISADIYYSTEDDYYVDTSVFRIGDYIIMPDSGEKFPISKKGTLIGVYNINKGYADFSQITILYQNKEYSIVKSNTDYGLNVYDHIVLEGKSVNADDFIFQ
ncbi:MAG: HlyD family efflux transporter periplasmic adaptor subunit [Lachnospiraceae bacterium]|nr:HlyD family efflux transporter periplasmic adaptor subunit [Lachnospiraceae bacterium]